ncbi:MAG: PAS domain S-box protein [Candidatus Omnitrophica bacterium]|nr:PAS domain S-box protein [Candidatus Omnitrophota bacterium]
MKKNNKDELEILRKEIEKGFLNNEILKNISLMIGEGFSINCRGEIIYCNEKYAEIFGYEKNEIIGKKIWDLCSESEKNFWLEILKEEKEGEFETRCTRKDGLEIILKVKVKNIKYKDKTLRVAIVRDITEEKVSFLKIKESEEKYKILTETLLDGIVVIDKEGWVLFSNFIGANLFGYDKVENFIGKNLFDFIINKEEFEQNLKLVNKNKSGYFIEHEIRDSKGARFFIETIGKKINFINEEGILLCFRDVTERKMMIENLREAINSTKRMLNQAVMALSETLTQRDPYTFNHQKRVAKLSVEIAKELGFSGSLIEGMKIVSLLHDIGKIYIPTDILAKPGKLNNIEWDFIKMHPEYGANIVKNIEFPWDIAKIIIQHHERLNGSGYPFGLKGEEIILESRILSVADVVEAMSSHRPYRPKLLLERALEEIKNNSNILYDGEVVKKTLKIFKRGFTFEDC